MVDEIKLPDQVQKQGEDAQKLWDEQHGKTEKKEGIPPVKAPDAEPPEPGQEPPLEPVITEPVKEPVLLEPEPEPSDFKHKFDVLQGKYDAEVPRISAENKQLRDHTIELSQIIATLQAEIEKIKASPAPEKKDPVVDTNQMIRQVLSDEEAEELEGMIDPGLLGKIVNKLVKNQIQSLEQNVTNIQATQVKSAEDVFYERVDAIPNVKTVNVNPAFNTWLDLKAPYTRYTRRQILESAQANLDADTVVELFGDFAKVSGTPTVPVVPTPPGGKPRISPAKGAGSGAGVPATGKIWTVSEINEFYINVQKGKYKGRDKERKQLEQDIWNAQKEGRVQRT